MDSALQVAEQALARGDAAAAAAALAPLFEGRARAGDAACALAARLMRDGRFAPSAMDGALAGLLDRLVTLVREQERQIEALRAMVETAL